MINATHTYLYKCPESQVQSTHAKEKSHSQIKKFECIDYNILNNK